MDPDARHLLSILIPVYNVAPCIRATVESLFRQHDPRVEYVFVNDRSPDDSWAVLEKTLADYPDAAASVRLLEHEKNRGVEAARITALGVATGEYIWFVDSDDIIAPGAIKAVLNALVDTRPDYLALKFKLLLPGETFASEETTFRHRRIDSGKLFESIVFSNSQQHGAWVNIVRRKLTAEHPMLRSGLKIGEDYVMHCYWVSFAESAASLSPAVYGYVQRQQSVTHKEGVGRWLSCFKRAHEILRPKLAEELKEPRRKRYLTALMREGIWIRMTFFCKVMNEFPLEERKELLRDYDTFFGDYTLSDAFRAVPLVLIPVMLCDKLRCYRLMRLYTGFGAAARKLLMKMRIV